jgi:hypothetical protein
MRAIKVLALSLLMIALIISGWFYLALLSTEKTVLNYNYYEELLLETNAVEIIYQDNFDRLPDIMRNQIYARADQETIALIKEKEALFNLVISVYTSEIEPPWLEEQLLVVIDDVLSLIKGEQQTLSAVIDLEKIESGFERLMRIKLKSLRRDEFNALGGHPAVIVAQGGQIMRLLGVEGEINLKQVQREKVIPAQFSRPLACYNQFLNNHLLIYLWFILIFILMILLARPAGGLKLYGSALLISGLSFYAFSRYYNNLLPQSVISNPDPNFVYLSPDLVEAAISYTAERIEVLPLIFAASGAILLVIGLVYGFVARKA